MKTFKIVGEDLSDGYHTFDELYEHRVLLYINLCLLQPHKCAWKEDFEGWFCLYLELPKGQISYHCPKKYVYLVESAIQNIPAYKWDGHTSDQVLERLK